MKVIEVVRSGFLFGVLFSIGLAGCGSLDGSDNPTEQLSRSIVNGIETSDWPAIGALVLEDPFQSFCSGTLIDQDWVLTAAHCVQNEMNLEPYMVSFFIGPDATSNTGGQVIPLDAFYVHSDPVNHDIAMVHLKVPPSGVTPIPYNISGSIAYDDLITMVGYGINVPDGSGGGTGSGIKRYGTTRIFNVYSNTFDYYKSAQGQISCYGDSGGATLKQFNSEERVIGVIAKGGENCTIGGLSMRVSYYASWIADVLANGSGEPDCEITGGDCGLKSCIWLDPDAFRCKASDGKKPGEACDSNQNNWTTAVPCSDGNFCMNLVVEFGGEGEVCYELCRSAEDCPAEHMCDFVFPDLPDTGVCLYYPECRITGGDCSADRACYLASDGKYRCHPSDGKALSQSCSADPSKWTRLPCADGLVCVPKVPNSSIGQCRKSCLGDGDCVSTEYCQIPVIPDIQELGACFCHDQDQDQYCVPEDCNDQDPDIHPNAFESCDSVDNDCDQKTDEDFDIDQDGHTTCGDPVDCNDEDPEVYPSASEKCDGKDNNCDGSTDEGFDRDQDGFLACGEDADCDDENGAVHPGAIERCRDEIDNDCDQQTDEKCDSCIDQDQDGYCQADDCNDQNPAAYPGGQEICADALDNNCDGQADEKCGIDCENDVDCNDGNFCTLDSCLLRIGCQYQNQPDDTPCGTDQVCSDGQCQSFALPAPELLSPPDGIRLQTSFVDLILKNLPEAKARELTYTFEIYQADNPEPFLVKSDIQAAVGSMTQVRMENLPMGASFHWRARAVDDNLTPGEWSETWTFSTEESSGGGGCASGSRDGGGFESGWWILAVLMVLRFYRLQRMFV